jgi:hypothetical protein
MMIYTLLPIYAEDLGQAFGTPAFTEFVAYIGVVGLGLAMLGARFGKPSRLRRFFVGLVVVGILLGLGGYDPLYFVLFKLVPGFDLFRTPARWMLLYTFGAAMLAGLGAEWLATGLKDRSRLPLPRLSSGGRRSTLLLLVALLVACVSLIWLAKPAWPTWAGWGGALLVASTLLVATRRAGSTAQKSRPWFLGALLLVELLAASQQLPHSDPTAPEAVESLRTAPAHILSEEGLHRFLSLSDITYDPGDLSDLEHLYGQQVSEAAMYDLIVASKKQEILVPNLPLYLRIQAVDGYGGGILPLARYNSLQSLFLDESQVSPDGRLREQLQAIPAVELLDLVNVKYVITDKLLDVWVDDVYYDLQNRAVLGYGSDERLALTELPLLNSTSLGVVSHLEGGQELPDHAAVAEIVLVGPSGQAQQLLLRAGVHTSEGVRDGTVAHAAPRVVETRKSTLDNPRGHEYVALLPFDAPISPTQITVRLMTPTGRLVLRGLTLLDQRTGAHHALSVSQGGRLQRAHSGDVKIYENARVLPRAYVVHQAQCVPDETRTLEKLLEPSFNPATAVVLSAPHVDKADVLPRSDHEQEIVEVQVYEPERVVVHASLEEDGFLVVSDTNYPGWKVWVDGTQGSILSANLLMRAVRLDKGDHLVEFRYEPASFRRGSAISLSFLAGVLLAGIVGALRKGHAMAGRKRPRDV